MHNYALWNRCLKSTFLKILFLCTLYICSVLKTKEEPKKNQRRTKERPKNAEIENVRFVKIAVSFTSLIPCLKTPSDDRENSERTPTQLPAYKKCFFLRLLPKKVVPLPKKVDSLPENVSFLYLLASGDPDNARLRRYGVLDECYSGILPSHL